MTDYFRNFQINGLIKLAFGLLFIVIGSMDREIYISVLGAILILITVANKGACPGNSCSSNLYKREKEL
uniref:hypothetical protein n=1 Tax=Chryseobacterium vaccae TaxID=2604424 RepID=UPI001297631F|nr:hypothetical protein [Chryseobacterium vaccae]